MQKDVWFHIVLMQNEKAAIVNMTVVQHKAGQTKFIVSHQHPLPLRPAASSAVIITFQAMTHPLLLVMARAP